MLKTVFALSTAAILFSACSTIKLGCPLPAGDLRCSMCAAVTADGVCVVDTMSEIIDDLPPAPQPTGAIVFARDPRKLIP